MAGTGGSSAQRGGHAHAGGGAGDCLASARWRFVARLAVAYAAVADGVWLVPALARAWPVRPPDVRGGDAAAARRRTSFDANTGDHRYPDGHVHPRTRPAWL